MFTQIIWATDGTEHAVPALKYAAGLARQSGAVLHATQVLEQSVSDDSDPDRFGDEIAVDARIRERATAAADEYGIETELHLCPRWTEDGVDRIGEVAGEVGADLIVIGTHGPSAPGSAALDSVAKRLLQISPCPVIAVPARVALSAAPERSVARREDLTESRGPWFAFQRARA